MKRHDHEWVEAQRVFVPPTNRPFQVTGEPGAVIQQAVHGFTSIELHCSCGDITERRLLGDHTVVDVVIESGEPRLQRLIQRATYELQNMLAADSLSEAEHRELAEAALRGAGVIR